MQAALYPLHVFIDLHRNFQLCWSLVKQQQCPPAGLFANQLSNPSALLPATLCMWSRPDLQAATKSNSPCAYTNASHLAMLRCMGDRRHKGFREMDLMDDLDLVMRLRRHEGRPVIVPGAVMTSARRWQRLGLTRTTIINQALVLAWRAGIPHHTLAKWYHGAARLEGWQLKASASHSQASQAT